MKDTTKLVFRRLNIGELINPGDYAFTKDGTSMHCIWEPDLFISVVEGHPIEIGFNSKVLESDGNYHYRSL